MFDPYLNFGGNCREAFTRYHDIFGGELFVMGFDEMPDGGEVPPEQRDLVLHAALTFDGGHILMASDAPDFNGVEGTYVSYRAVDVDEAKRVFDALGEGGQVEMDLQETFWSPAYGSCRDRFGTLWMVSAPGEDQRPS